MAKGDSNPSLSLDTLFPTLSDESFLQFLKDYYRFLQSTKLTLTGVSGTFVKGEVITGADSKATGTVFFVGTNEIVVVMNTELPLDSAEVITGSTSGATATISLVKDNVIRESARLKDARSQYVSGDEFFQLLKDEVNSGYPSTSQADRRLLYNRIRDLLQSKSTEEAYRFLFKAFFDENIEIRFPGDDLLRVSDGKFEKTSLIRVVPTNTNAFPIGGIFDFLNKTIRGQTSGAVGTVVNISISFLGGVQYAEFNLKLVSGEFEAGETVADVLQSRLSTQVFGIIGDIQINDGGSGYSVGEAITITGDGAEATAEVSSISTGPINKILVNVPGYGYRLNTKAAINNTDTAGANLQIAVTSIANTYTVTDGANTYTVGDTSRIQIVNRGFGYQRSPVITLVDSTIQSIGLLSERLITIANSGTDYAVGEILTFTGGSGNSAAGQVASVGNTAPFGEENILFEDDFVLTQEQEVNGLKSAIKSEDWGNLGSILRIELTNLGVGYLSNNLPTLTLESANTVSGANASFTVNGIQGVSANVEVDIANNAVGIGSIREISIRNPGINFSSANVSATTVGDGNANLEAIISGLNVNRGFFTNDDGKISFKIIQDSFFYQDFSYVIRSGLIINAYQELVKETVHPAGLEFFGEIVITSIIALRAEFRSQIDQSPRPLALSTFISLYPAGINLPYAGAIREVEITPEFIDQKIKPRTSKFLKPSGASDDKNLSIREIAFERGISVPAEFSAREIVNKLYLYIDVALFPTFSDVVTGTIPIIPVELDYILSGISNIVDTHREYQIEIAPIRMEQPLAVRDFNVREIEIVKNIDAAVNIDDVKTQTTFLNADQYGETPLSFFAESLISSLSGNTFLDFTGFETPVQRFFRRIDTQGLEVDIELVSTDLKAQVVDSTSFGTEQEVPLFVSVPLIRSFVDEIVNRLEIHLDVSAQIVFNDVQILETTISDIVLKIESGVATTLDTGREYRIHLTPEKFDQPLSVRDFNIREIEIVKNIDTTTQNYTEYEIDLFSKADTTTYYLDQLIADFASEQISEYASLSFTDLITIPLAAPGFKPTEYTLRIELPLVTVAANLQPFRIFVDRLRLPSLDTGVTIIDATLAFEGTTYEIEMRPQFVQFAPTPIPQTTGRLKRLTYILPPVVATINNIYEVIKIQKEIDVASTISTSITYRIESPLIDQALIGVFDFNEVEITPATIDLRMAFYSEIYTMTNRIHTTEIEIQSEIVVAPIPRMKLEIDVPPGFTAPFKETLADIQIATLASEVIQNVDPIEDYSNKTFLDTAYRYQSMSKTDIDYRIEIYQFIDSRMRFYSEILTMTNREMTVELEVFSGPVDVSTNHGRLITINYSQWADVPLLNFSNETIATYSANSFNESPGISFTKEVPSTFYEIDIEPVRSQVVSLFIPTALSFGNTVRYIDLYIDSRMSFYSEILSMTNRVHTTEIDIFSFTNTAAIAPQETPINYIITPSVIDVSLAGVRDFNIREIEIVPTTIDLRMAFYTEIYTMTNRVHTTEIDILLEVDVAPIPRMKLEIDIPINPRTVIGEERIEVYAEELIQNYELSTFNDSVNRNAVRLNTASEVIKYLELAVVDLRMAFYSEIYTMTNRIHTTEIEIQSGPVNVAPSLIRTITFGVNSYGNAPIELFASNTIADFNGVTTDSSEFKADSTEITADEFPITFNTPANLTATRQIPSSFYKLEIPFYEEVTVNVDRAQEVIKEIELPLEQVTSTVESLPINRIIESNPMFVGLAQGELTLTQANRLEIILSSKYGEAVIENYSGDSIAKFAGKTFEDDIALGASEFSGKSWTFDELSLRAFKDDQIEDFENDEIDDIFELKSVQKNVKINGTVTFTDPGFAGTRIRAVAGIEINSYSANTLNDLSGSNTSVFGTSTEFTIDYLVNESLITNTEKFLVTTVANNTYLEINVNPEENYNDVSVYREYFV